MIRRVWKYKGKPNDCVNSLYVLLKVCEVNKVLVGGNNIYYLRYLINISVTGSFKPSGLFPPALQK